jgi:hypothetical protein
MSKLYGDDEELTHNDAQMIKAMIERGDKNETIAAYFGVNQRAISHVRSGKKFSDATPKKTTELPPPGPYRVDPSYVHFYQTMTKVNELWNQKKLPAAKSLLEAALNNPVFTEDLSDFDNLVGEIMRDEYGLAPQ